MGVLLQAGPSACRDPVLTQSLSSQTQNYNPAEGTETSSSQLLSYLHCCFPLKPT